MNRYVCIHGHFYQPPRENPWLEDVELQDSAHPFHDWNDRITDECYEPNTASRILDEQGRITDIVNNYARISFNFGPTLLSWLELHHPVTYGSILEADRRSRENFSGHGAAIAQAYNHLIMPLANRRDKETQVLWGIRDFVRRFGREPEGMWLPETAVDLETLEILTDQGIRFTILAPHQAGKTRKIGEERWQDDRGARIDTTMPYLCRLPSGKTIHLFFYDGPVARDVAFSGLLKRGEVFAKRLLGTISGRKEPQLAHIATDGETYGHHHRFGDMALAFCLNFITEEKSARITIYGEHLEKFPPTHEVEIIENTSWSCAHGVERWRADCGCRIGGDNGWSQAWRAPLREALDWLRDQLIPFYEAEAKPLLRDPWQARNDYIAVILDRSEGNVRDFLNERAGRVLNGEERLKALRLLEMQRQALLMYTSCGWFFDELSGIETAQVLAYAGRALQLTRELCDTELEAKFLEKLEKAPSNVPKWRNGAGVYQGLIKPQRLDLLRVAAHHAIACEFEGDHGVHKVYCYTAENKVYEHLLAGMPRLGLGLTHIRSEVTGNEGDFAFAVLHLGGHNLNAGVREYENRDAFDFMRREIREAFEKSDIPEVMRLMGKHFGSHSYTLWHLFRDEQRKVLNQIMDRTLKEIEATFRQIFERHFTLMRFLQEINMPVPRSLAAPVEAVLNAQLRRLLESDSPDLAEIRRIAADLAKLPVSLDKAALGYVATRQVDRQMERLLRSPCNPDLVEALNNTLEVFLDLPLQLDLWKAQNSYFAHYRTALGDIEDAGEQGNKTAEEVLQQLRRLGGFLQVEIG